MSPGSIILLIYTTMRGINKFELLNRSQAIFKVRDALKKEYELAVGHIIKFDF